MKNNIVNIMIRNKDESLEQIKLKEKVVLSCCLASLIAMEQEIESKGHIVKEEEDIKEMLTMKEMLKEVSAYTWQRIELLDELSVFPLNYNDLISSEGKENNEK